MQTAGILCAFSLLLCSVLVHGLNFNLNSLNSNNLSSNNSPRLCIVTNCNYNGPQVCGRMGSSNLCKRFQNNCLFLAESCRPTYRYTAVNLSMCSGIAVGAQRRCTGLASNSSNTNTLPITIIRG